MDPHFDGVIFQTHAVELARRMRREFPAWYALDVRQAGEYAAGHIPGSRPASAAALASGLPDGTDQGTEFFVIGAGPGDPRVREASLALRALGANRIVELSAGISEWTAFGLELNETAA